ncbi:MAG: hypothetical protein KDE00_06550 [Rhodobacteraceae bacterium]|nr:hypothetical protein [Paracoccaceae bacterium]
MSLFDIAGQYPTQTAARPAGQGLFGALTGLLRRSRADDIAAPEIDANTLKHMRREQGYLRDVGMEMGF